MENQTQQPAAPSSFATATPTEQPASGYGRRNWKKWVVVYVLIGALIYAGVYYFVFSKQGASPYPIDYKTTTPQLTPVTKVKTNVNPNTGDLYQDIKVRMKEVLK